MLDAIGHLTQMGYASQCIGMWYLHTCLDLCFPFTIVIAAVALVKKIEVCTFHCTRPREVSLHVGIFGYSAYITAVITP